MADTIAMIDQSAAVGGAMSDTRDTEPFTVDENISVVSDLSLSFSVVGQACQTLLLQMVSMLIQLVLKLPLSLQKRQMSGHH